MERVGIRELRQNLSVYVRRVVENAETLEVTDHGRPIALLTPLPKDASRLDELIRSGRVRPPADPGPIRAARGVASRRGTEALEEQRADRR
jgi:prevent-host-death family protein